MNKIAQRFDQAAADYDDAAPAQAQVAAELVARASTPAPPLGVLDIGCGTGFVSCAVARRWPQAAITALDASQAMLQEAQRKLPKLKLVAGDAASAVVTDKFDLIFSSMALHWLAEPEAVLRRWQGWLKPGGRLYVALPVMGSFQEWRDLCAGAGVKDGLWPLPPADFCDDAAHEVEIKDHVISYASAADFLRKMKSIGAATPDKNHRPATIPVMRAMLAKARRPFVVNYRIAYLTRFAN